MRWYDDLYIGYNLLENKNQVIEKIKTGKPQLNIYVLTLPWNDYDVLEIYPSYALIQKWYRDSNMVVIGLAEGMEEAMDMMQLVIMDCYRATGGFQLKEFIMKQMTLDDKNISKEE